MAKEKTIDPSVIETSLYGGKVSVKFYGPTPDKPSRHMYFVDGDRKSGATTFIGILDKSAQLIGWATDLACDHLLDMLGRKAPIGTDDVIAACGLHEVRKGEAADIGRDIHAWCEEYIRHALKEKEAAMPAMPENPAVQMGAAAFMNWVREHKVKFLSTERLIYSKKHDYVGTLDIEAMVDGKRCLVDLKTGNGLYNSVRLQTAAYLMADQEERPAIKYDGRWAIRLSKETEAEYNDRMAKKNSRRLARGKDPVSIKPYQVFEAQYLDDKPTDLARDFKGFLAAQALFNWNKETNPYGKGKD